MANTWIAVQQAISRAMPQPFVGGENLIHGDVSAKALTAFSDWSATGVPGGALPGVYGYTFDPSQIFQARQILSLQTVFLDNSANNAPAYVQSSQFGQIFALPAGYQGFFPVLASAASGGKFLITSPLGTGTTTAIFLNVYFAAETWPAVVSPLATGVVVPVSDAALEALIVAGRFNVRTLAAQATGVDRSATLVAGSQILIPANAARQGFIIQNMDTVNFEALWYSFVGAAAIGAPGSFSLAAGSSANFPGGAVQGVVSNQITVIATTVGHKVSALEW